MPVLVAMSGRYVPRPIQQLERSAIASAGPRHPIQARNRLDVVIEDVRTGVEHGAQRRLDALEVGNQHLDAAVGHARPRPPDRVGEDRRAAVGQVVAIDRRDDGVLQAHALDGFGDARRLRGVELASAARAPRRNTRRRACRRRRGS